MIAVRVLRPFRVRGDAFSVGAIVKLAPLDAHAVLGSRRAELVDPADLGTVVLAVGESNRAALAVERNRTGDFRPWR